MKKLSLAITLIGAALSAGASTSKTDLQLIGQQGVHYFFTLSKPWIEDQRYVGDTLTSFCSTKDVCIAHIWEKGQAAPTKFPLSDKEVSLEAATLQFNKNTKRSNLLWSCKKFPSAGKDQCF